jgi:hypothetical protein
LSQSVEIYDDSESISVSDIAVYSLDINDILAGGTISISSAVSILEGGTITTSPIVENIQTDPATTVQVQVAVDSPNQVSITIADSNSVTVTDDMAFPAAIANPAFGNIIGNPFTVVGENVGLHIANPQHELHLSGSLFSPLVTSSRMEIQGNGVNDLFIVKAHNSEETKFVINLQGVTILGQFHDTPTPEAGGMFYSSSGDFYLGN